MSVSRRQDAAVKVLDLVEDGESVVIERHGRQSRSSCRAQASRLAIGPCVDNSRWPKAGSER
jgi:hypothetical protein